MYTYITVSVVISLLLYLLVICVFLLYKEKKKLTELEKELSEKYRIYYQGKYDEAIIDLKEKYNHQLTKKECEYKQNISKLNEKHKKIVDQIKSDNDREKLILLAKLKRR